MKEINVLILDDEENILNSLKRLFRSEEFGIFTTTNHKEALECLKNEKIKIVMSDYRMPDVTGTDFLKQVKEINPEIIRILFTGHSDIRIAEDAINKGEVYRFINKPWEDVELKTTITDAIKRFDMAEHNRALSEHVKKQNEELLLLNAKLKNMYEGQKDFTSTVSHELRTPLGSIKTMLDIIVSGTAGELTDIQKDFLGKTLKNVDRLGRLIDDILSLSKLESGTKELSIAKGDINETIQEVVDLLKPVAEKKGLYLKTAFSSDIIMVDFDPDKINQVMNNLIYNAIIFTSEGGIEVMSYMEKEKNNLTVSVKDTGPGIKDEDKVKLFQKFQQLGDHATRETGGTGLGLAICREIIEKHGGKIWIDSIVGEGSTFSFLLPASRHRAG
ncbi:MAG: hybrid sensor histidine kinase/response regulator [Candidatus Omnitrophica bacterium]|nr:hybrid sensor histidine kinase/response regulator [Candidatus Omnitrophota bacterium]